MAEWIPPKTNWVAGDIPGAGDFNRIEENAKYLKDYCLFWYEPSDEMVVESLSEKTVTSATLAPMKSFRFFHPGRYRIELEARRTLKSSGWIVESAVINFSDEHSVQPASNINVANAQNWTPYIVTRSLDVGDVLTIRGRGTQRISLFDPQPLAVSIRNVRIYGSPVIIAPPTVIIS